MKHVGAPNFPKRLPGCFKACSHLFSVFFLVFFYANGYAYCKIQRSVYHVFTGGAGIHIHKPMVVTNAQVHAVAFEKTVSQTYRYACNEGVVSFANILAVGQFIVVDVVTEFIKGFVKQTKLRTGLGIKIAFKPVFD